jgi:hypothetical protein
VVPVPPPCEPPPAVVSLNPQSRDSREQSSAAPTLSSDALDSILVSGIVSGVSGRSHRADVVLAGLTMLPPPTTVRRPKLHFSVIAQIDAIVYKEMKARLERDVLATSADVAVTRFWGHPSPGVPLGAVDGLYWGPVDTMHDVVAAVASQHGRGVFILSLAAIERSRNVIIGNIFGAKVGGGVTRRVPWFEFLKSYSRLTFTLKDRPDLVAVYASFHHAITPRPPPRKTSAFVIAVIPRFGHARHLGAVPDVVARATNPLPDERELVDEGPDREPDFEQADLPPVPAVAPSQWNVPEFVAWARSLPDSTIRQLAIDVVSMRLDPLLSL